MNGDQEKIYIEDDEAFEEAGAKKKVRVLVFALGDENYCIDVREAKEVVRMPSATRVPNVPGFVIGVANFRGEILSILDLHYFFGVETKGQSKEIRMIVTDIAGEKIGLLVDRVKDTLEIEEDRVQEPLATIQGKLAAYTKGQIPFGNDILIYLNLKKVLECEDIRNLKKGEAV